MNRSSRINSDRIPNNLWFGTRPILFWVHVKDSLRKKNLQKFELVLDKRQDLEIGQKEINNFLLDAVEKASNEPTNEPNDGICFIEMFMEKIYTSPSYFACWDCSTCRKIVNQYLSQKRKFTDYTIGFLLRCNSIDLVNKSFDAELIGQGLCSNWHIMFITSYREKFFLDCIDRSIEGFLARFILICRLRCSPIFKREFLTWFAGLCYLYSDEYFYRNDENHIKFVVLKLFDALIVAGLLTFTEFKNVFEMMITRNDKIKLSYEARFMRNAKKDINNNNFVGSSNAKRIIIPDMAGFFVLYTRKYPLSLKNMCRLTIKNSMTNYTRKDIKKLGVPAYLERFLYFDPDFETVYNEVYDENFPYIYEKEI